MISRSGGTGPHWRKDGKALFYLAPDGTILSVAVEADRVLQIGETKALFKAPPGPTTAIRWDVSPDGERFLFPTMQTAAVQRPFTVVLNWQDGLKR
jgi:hypothetical protein